MAALSAERLTRRVGLKARPEIVSFRVKGSTKIYKGALVVLDAGYAKPAVTATGLICVGRATETVDNTSGSDGALRILVETGTFAWDNASAGNACTAADIGATVYCSDDHTITKTSTGASAAGKLIDILSDGQVAVCSGLGSGL